VTREAVRSAILATA